MARGTDDTAGVNTTSYEMIVYNPSVHSTTAIPETAIKRERKEAFRLRYLGPSGAFKARHNPWGFRISSSEAFYSFHPSSQRMRKPDHQYRPDLNLPKVLSCLRLLCHNFPTTSVVLTRTRLKHDNYPLSERGAETPAESVVS
jgi:hypothetical protein